MFKDKFICKYCKKEFENYDSLRRHAGRIHQIKSENFYIEFYLNGIYPTCKCGCNEKVNFHLGKPKEYKQGHISRIKNNWGHNQNAIDKSTETRREQYKNSERQAWNKGLDITDERIAKIAKQSRKENNPERAKKISKTQKKLFKSGILSNSGNDNPMFGKTHSKESKDKMRAKRVYYLQNKFRKLPTELENDFMNILYNLNIEYTFQYILDDFSYDFYLPKQNIILEVDGDWWHCNPKIYKNGPEGDIQIHTVEHDRIKNEICKKNNIRLIRFWESDIKKNRPEVIKTLIKELKI